MGAELQCKSEQSYTCNSVAFSHQNLSGSWSPVNVDADEVVDGGAEENDHEAGDGVAHLPAQLPPAHQPRVTCYKQSGVTCHKQSRVTCYK